MMKAEQKYLVAVSGGVDSVVLLDMLAHRAEYDITVAHFDHGIREDSQDDARFVEGLAAHYSLPFVMLREELGASVSEEKARDRRYAILRSEAAKRNAMIVTAHHADDIIETMAINTMRGTGWRGIAVLDTPGIARPLLGVTKKEIREYALKKRLEWVEDSTNIETIYLRNRLRRKISQQLPTEQKKRLLELWHSQLELKKSIDIETGRWVQPDACYSRHPFIMIGREPAREILRRAILAVVGQNMTRPQLDRSLLAIKTALPGSVFEAGGGVRLRFSQRNFVVETP